MKPVNILLLLSLISFAIILAFLWKDNKNQKTNNNIFQERYDNSENINDLIEKRYNVYKKDISKYRIGVPGQNYDNLDQRFHEAPSPSELHQTTLPSSNKLFFANDEIDKSVQYCDMLNK